MITLRTNRVLYGAIVVNLLLWMAVVADFYGVGTENTKTVAVAGFVFAAVVQHWGYYALWKVPPDPAGVP